MAATAADILIDTIHYWGVEVVFGLPGDGINGIMEALRVRKDLDVPHRVLGGGSNLVVVDEGLDELVVNTQDLDHVTVDDQGLVTAEGGANLIEIDLLRGGHWVLAVASRRVRKSHRGPYRICVVRATKSYDAEVYRASFSRPLPRVRIPLRRDDQDAILNLQPLVNQAYANGQYGDIDYRVNPDPPFLAEEQARVDELLKKAGKR